VLQIITTGHSDYILTNSDQKTRSPLPIVSYVSMFCNQCSLQKLGILDKNEHTEDQKLFDVVFKNSKLASTSECVVEWYYIFINITCHEFVTLEIY